MRGRGDRDRRRGAGLHRRAGAPDPDPTGESSGTSGGEPPDPNTLHVRLSNQVATCADPNAGIECGNNWQVSIRIPVAYQTPGLYHLLGPTSPAPRWRPAWRTRPTCARSAAAASAPPSS
ncbi:hypothetical protein [Nannocystis pusilla]|uniref:hypothetical protein n=1 Tax=Nannocystis pusilla TaxID=889268 RepID=UPI003B7B3BD0